MTTAAVATPRSKQSLLAEHHEIEGMLDRLIVTAASGARDDLGRHWVELRTRLLRHFDEEESALVPAVLRTRQRDACVVLQEHRHLRARLDEISDKLRAASPAALTIRDFRDELKAHTQTENRLLYPWADASRDA